MDSPMDLAAYEAMDPSELHDRIEAVRRAMGSELLILGHHYQTDDVIQHADLRGDSFQLAKLAAANTECRTIVFCGVHFMAETADILANRPEMLEKRVGARVQVLLPNMEAGCPMADMASRPQVEHCWEQLSRVIDTNDVTPVTYVNSSADLKAFCGRHGGVVCTSSNAASILKWAFGQRSRVLFFPDQHLGRNTAHDMGIAESQMPVWDPDALELGGNTPEAIADAKVILWQGFCNVHMKFLPEHVDNIRKLYPGIRVIVHPESKREVVEKSDAAGSTGAIISAIQGAAPGSRWAIGTEASLVERQKIEHPEQEIHHLSPAPSTCWTMKKITLSRLCQELERLAAGVPMNIVSVDDDIARDAEKSLMRMLEQS